MLPQVYFSPMIGPDGSNYTAWSFFYKKPRGIAGLSSRRGKRKHLPMCDLIRIRVLVRFFGTVLALTTSDPTDQWKRWSGARSVGKQSPPLFCPRSPVRDLGPRGLSRDSPVFSTFVHAGPIPRRAPGRRFSFPPHAYTASQRTPLLSPLLPPQRASLFFTKSSRILSFPHRAWERGETRRKANAEGLKVCGRCPQ
jgi:hypothetical protein